MSNNDDLPMSEHDGNLSDAIDLLRSVEPQATSLAKNRNVIATELARLEKSVAAVPWWGQSVSVPVPVAMAVCAAFLVLIVTWLPSWREVSIEGNPIADPSVVDGQDPVESKHSTLAKRDLKNPRLEYEASETYLCGIGRIKYESIYHYRED